MKAPDASLSIFGGILIYDGMGYYPGVELLNFIFGTPDDNLLPSGGPILVKRVANEFARKLVWDDGFNSSDFETDVLYDEQTESSIRYLMECLQLEIPNLRKKPTWERAHFFPYTRSLIHWDARNKSNGISIERRYLRGGGAFAFHVLRKDKDQARLQRCRDGFAKLFSEEKESPLEKLASVLADAGKTDDEPSEDTIEPKSVLKNDGHEELYRESVVRIIEHTELSSATRIKAIINWTAFWLINLQHCRAADYLEKPHYKIICDCGAGHPQLRRASQRCLKDIQTLILEAVDRSAKKANAEMSKKQRDQIRSFFWATAASIKMLNAWSGRRHFTLGLDILETLVLASTGSMEELPFDQFIDEWLFGKFNIVTGVKSAERSGLLSYFDASIFEDNESELALHMTAAGLLKQYSDATRMVNAGLMK